MRWYHYLAWFFGGVFLVNSIPHLVHGISGMPFHSPFATPPNRVARPPAMIAPVQCAGVLIQRSAKWRSA